MTTGFLLINKPKDWTSHDVVAYLRRVTGEKRIGHAGTLDPFATGLLIVGIGREATKRLEEFKQMKKEYIATVKLGYVSDTQDSTGKIQPYNNITIEQLNNVSKKNIQDVISKFVGKILQTPPMFSAKKINGQRLYKLARRGVETERRPQAIEIFNIELLEIRQLGELEILVTSSPGTYIRTLAHDIGQALGVGAYCESLERTAIGKYKVEDAVEVKMVNKENWEEYLFQDTGHT